MNEGTYRTLRPPFDFFKVPVRTLGAATVGDLFKVVLFLSPARPSVIYRFQRASLKTDGERRDGHALRQLVVFFLPSFRCAVILCVIRHGTAAVSDVYS